MKNEYDVLKWTEELLEEYQKANIYPKILSGVQDIVFVHEYSRSNGTEVRAHYRSKPDGDESNNLSFNSSTNSGKSTGGATKITSDKRDGLIIKSVENITGVQKELIE